MPAFPHELTMKQRRSPITAFILAASLGPVGFIYTNLIGGLIAIILSVATFSTIAVPLSVWVLCAALAPLIVFLYNRRTSLQKKISIANTERSYKQSNRSMHT